MFEQHINKTNTEKEPRILLSTMEISEWECWGKDLWVLGFR